MRISGSLANEGMKPCRRSMQAWHLGPSRRSEPQGTCPNRLVVAVTGWRFSEFRQRLNRSLDLQHNDHGGTDGEPDPAGVGETGAGA